MDDTNRRHRTLALSSCIGVPLIFHQVDGGLSAVLGTTDPGISTYKGLVVESPDVLVIRRSGNRIEVWIEDDPEPRA